MSEVHHTPNGVRRIGLILLTLTFLGGCQELPTADSGAGTPALRSIELPAPAGGSRTIVLSERQGRAELSDGVHRHSLPVAAAHVLGIGPVPAQVSAALGRGEGVQLALSGPYQPQAFQPEGLEMVDSVPPRPSPTMPLYVPVLPRLQASSWGAEARAEVTAGSGRPMVLQCAAGQSPAGVRLDGALAGALGQRRVALRLRVRGEGVFPVLVADDARSQTQDPLPAGLLAAAAGWQQVDIPLPAQGWQPEDWRSLTLACPGGPARLEVDVLELVLADRVPSPGMRALWVWSPSAWRDDPEGLLSHLAGSQASEVFVTVPLADEKCTGDACRVALPEALGHFLEAASRAGVHVWAVAGDPRAVLPEERQAWTGRAAAYARFNDGQPAGARLAGIQYDVEAYLVPGYGQDPPAWNRRYLELLTALRDAGPGLPVDVVVPWWFGQGGASPPELLEAVAGAVDRLTVMDYRTDAAQVVQSALPFLDWGQRHGRSVHVAVESGPLPDMEWRSYGRASQGELWVIDLDRGQVYALLDVRAQAEPWAQVFASRGGHLVRATQTTFHDRPEALWRMVARLEDVFGAAQAFGGVAIHGLDQAWY